MASAFSEGTGHALGGCGGRNVRPLLRARVNGRSSTGSRKREPAYRRGLAAARAQLDDAAWDAAWAAGRALPLAEAIAEALATGMGADDAGPVGGKARRE